MTERRPVNRRHFLELVGLGALGSIIRGPSRAPRLDRIGLQLYTVRDLTSVDGFRRAAAALNRAGEAAVGRGLAVAYHNHDFEFRPTGGIVPYDVLLAETDPSLVWMELDLYWIAKAKRDPLRYFAAHAGRFRLCHIKDIDSHGEIVDVGQGRLDFRTILRQGEQAGLRHFFVEHDHPRDPLESIATSYRFLDRLL